MIVTGLDARRAAPDSRRGGLTSHVPPLKKNNSVLFKIFVEAHSVFVPINVSRAHEPSLIDFESVTNSAIRSLRQEIDCRLTESTGFWSSIIYISLLFNLMVPVDVWTCSFVPGDTFCLNVT